MVDLYDKSGNFLKFYGLQLAFALYLFWSQNEEFEFLHHSIKNYSGISLIKCNNFIEQNQTKHF